MPVTRFTLASSLKVMTAAELVGKAPGPELFAAAAEIAAALNAGCDLLLYPADLEHSAALLDRAALAARRWAEAAARIALSFEVEGHRADVLRRPSPLAPVDSDKESPDGSAAFHRPQAERPRSL